MEANLQFQNFDAPLLKSCLERLLQLFECLTQVEECPDSLHLRLWTHKTDDTLRRAQEFLLSVTSENPAFEHQQSATSEALSKLYLLRNEIERDARVVLIFNDTDFSIRGPQANVELAMQLIEDFLTHGVKVGDGIKRSQTADSLLSDPIGMSLSRKDSRLARRVESEDSSYDSDTESGFGTQSTSNSLQRRTHDDVSRTVSDTLGAEFAEYVSTHKVDLESVLADPSYQTRLEFAVKLGYTEAQVQIALQRLGLSVSNNELLAELIKLSSNTKDSLRNEPPAEASTSGELRPIVIDGSNVAMSHGNRSVFSCLGIKICVDYFRTRGHREITVFVPSWRKEAPRPNTPITNQEILLQLEREKIVSFTPSRNVGGKRLVCYEDRYVLNLALQNEGIVVSNDNYRDLMQESAEFKKLVEDRLLMYTFVNDRFMPPDDPLGRGGPTLDHFLRKPVPASQQMPPLCPYARKCTYGNKCKYYHPERGSAPQKSIVERLAEQAKIQLQESKNRSQPLNELMRTRSVPVSSDGDSSIATGVKKKQPLGRTRSAAPSQRLQDELSVASSSFSGDAAWKHQSWSSLSKSVLSESGHLSLAKKLSDPDAHSDASKEQGNNLHKKLARQLTLNPTNDDRIAKMKLANTENRHSASHNNVVRLASDGVRPKEPFGDAWSMSGLSSNNSTSDTRLNSFPNQFVTPSFFQANIWSPIPSQQHVRPSSVPPQNRMRAPMVPPQHSNGGFGSGGVLPTVSDLEERNKLFYHLRSLFPEDQVKIAMELHPDELSAQPICATILSMFPQKP